MIVSFLLSLVYLAAVHQDTVLSLTSSWKNGDDSHGPLVFVLALFWAYALLKRDKPCVRAAPVFGTLVFLFGAFLKEAGEIVANNWLSHVSLLVVLCGFVLFLLGKAFFRTVRTPLFLLLFSIPLPPTLSLALTADLQLLSSSLSVALLHTLGLSAFQEGNVIDLGTIQLHVVEACSGLRYLYPLLGFSFFLAFWIDKNPLKRAIIFLSAVPIALIVNVLRIVLVGLSASFWGLSNNEGFVHAMEGWGLFVLCLAALAALAWGVSLWKTDTRENLSFFIDPKERLRSGKLGLSRFLSLSFLVLLSVSFGAHVFLSQREETVPVRHLFSSFPLHINDWTGRTQPLSQKERDSLGFDDHFLASYTRETDHTEVTLYMAYYASQRRTSSPHSPAVCLTGSGWDLTGQNSRFSLGARTVNRAVAVKDGETAVIYYWIEGRGRALASVLDVKLSLLRDALFDNRSDATLIRLSTAVTKGETAEAADRRMRDLAKNLFPLFRKFIPD